MSKRTLIALGLPLLSLAGFLMSTSANAACSCGVNQGCGRGYYCSPVPGGCGHPTLTGTCKKLGGTGPKKLDLPLTGGSSSDIDPLVGGGSRALNLQLGLPSAGGGRSPVPGQPAGSSIGRGGRS